MVSDGLFFNAPRLSDALLTLGAGFQGPEALAALQASKRQRAESKELQNLVRGMQTLPQNVQGPPRPLTDEEKLAGFSRLAALGTPGASTFVKSILDAQITPEEERAFQLRERGLAIDEQRLALTQRQQKRLEREENRRQKLQDRILQNLDSVVTTTEIQGTEQNRSEVDVLRQQNRQLRAGLLDPALKDFSEAQIEFNNEKIKEIRDLEKSKNLAARSYKSFIAKNDRVNSAIDKAIGEVGVLTAGPASFTAFLPGTPARDLEATISTIKANIGFDRLQEMRDASPTGGALGQVSERELQFLQYVIANLDLSQSPEQLQQNLNVVRQSLQESAQRLAEAYEQDFGSSFVEPEAPQELSPDTGIKFLGFED